MQSQLSGAALKEIPELQARINDLAAAIGQLNDVQLRLRNGVDRLVPRQPRAVPSTNQKDAVPSETMDAQLSRVIISIQGIHEELLETAQDLDRAV